MATYSMAEIQEQIARLPEHFAQELESRGEVETVMVTRHGKPVLAILPWELYESILETMEILADEEQMAAFREGVRSLERGEAIPWGEVKKELGW